MAVKPITNNQSTNSQKINRGKQKSFRNTDVGNSRVSVNPGKDFSKGFSITLKDIDTSFMNHIKRVMKPTVGEANEMLKVPVLYGNEERWKSVRGNGVLRDRNNVIILPVIIVKRSDVSFNDNMPLSFDHDTRGEFIKVDRSSKWSAKNRYDRFSVLQGETPVTEIITTGMPDFVVCTYSVVIMTAYMEQMNAINELFLEHLETYFGDTTDYKFLSSLDGGITDATEMDADGERLVRSELTVSIKAYVIPEFTSNVLGTTAEMNKTFTPRKTVFGFEGNASEYQVKK
jgi:hypothetical protein